MEATRIQELLDGKEPTPTEVNWLENAVMLAIANKLFQGKPSVFSDHETIQ